MYKPRTAAEWAFFGVTASQAVGTTIIDLFVLLHYLAWVNPEVHQVQATYVVPVNFGVFVLGNIYLAGLAFDALRAKNNLQLFGVCTINVGVFTFAFMRYGQTYGSVISLNRSYTYDYRPLAKSDMNIWPQVKAAFTASAILIGVCMVLSWTLTFRLHREFAWAIYRHISGSLSTRRKYLTYQALLVVVKLDIYFVNAFLVTYGLVDVHYAMPEFPLTMAIIPLVWIQLAMTVYFTKHENKLGAIAAIVLRLGEIAYLISRILDLNDVAQRKRVTYTLLRDEMLLFAGCSLALATIACLNATLCLFNFNHGLKPLLLDSSWEQGRHKFEPIHPQGRLSERLELD